VGGVHPTDYQPSPIGHLRAVIRLLHFFAPAEFLSGSITAHK